MKKIVLLVLLVILVSGCALSRIKTTEADGKTCEVDFISFYKNLGAVTGTLCGAPINITSSTVDPLLITILNAYLNNSNKAGTTTSSTSTGTTK